MVKSDTDFEIITSTTADILLWINSKNLHYGVSGEQAQIEIGSHVKSAIDRSRAADLANKQMVLRTVLRTCRATTNVFGLPLVSACVQGVSASREHDLSTIDDACRRTPAGCLHHEPIFEPEQEAFRG